MLKRLFDILTSLAGLSITLALYPFIALAIKLESSGPIFYCSTRVGLDGGPFTIIKFRTMVKDADRHKPITMKADSRVTKVGRWLRRFKLDELPTLFNVLKGDMSIIGPRPEIPQYVSQYTPEHKRVLCVRPGITDPGTLRFNNEADLLIDTDQFERIYLEQILPEKLHLNLQYIDGRSFFYDLRIIFLTLFLLIHQRKQYDDE